MSRIRTAVIGVGHFGRFHAQKYASEDHSELVAVVDRDVTRASEVAEELGARAETDHTGLLGQVDAVSIAVPTEAHYPVARFFLDNGVHVLVEKPITSTVEEADDLIARAEAGGLVLQVGHLERFLFKASGLMDRITRPLYVEALRIGPYKGGRGTDVSVVLDLMIHDIDLVAAVVGAPLVSLDAVGAPVLSPSEDIANARLKFETGCVATITASRIAFKSERKLRIFQPESMLSVNMLDRTVAHVRKTEGPDGPGFDVQQSSFEERDALRVQIRDFLSAIAERRAPVVTGRDGREALVIAQQVVESLQDNLARLNIHGGAAAAASRVKEDI